MQRVGGLGAVEALAVSAEHMLGREAPQSKRREEPQQRVDRQALARSAVVPGRADRVGDDEDALIEERRDLTPAPAPHDLHRRDPGGSARSHVQRHAQPLGDLRAIASVPVEKLDDAPRLAERSDSVVEPIGVEHVEQPDLPAVEDRVRRSLHELGLVGLPAEAGFELVDDSHRPEASVAKVKEALERARRRLNRLDLYPRPVRLKGVRVVVAPWFFRLPGLRRYHGYALIRTILVRSGTASDDLITHELCHLWQMQNRPLRVIWAWLTHRYRSNPYEIEARRAVELTSETGRAREA